MLVLDHARQNQLLAALPDSEWTQWRPQLEPVELTLGQVLKEPDGKLTHVYFPTSCIISLLYVTADGDSAEIAMVGREGIVGVSSFMGGETSRSRALLDRAELEKRTCECYAVVKKEYDRLLPCTGT